MEAPPAQRTRVRDVEIAWREAGEGARPLVLVHGYTGSHRDFAPRLAELAAATRVLVPDLRGHGDSAWSPDRTGYTLDALAQDLLHWMDAVGLERADVLGHSMGGMLLLRAALAHPERFWSLILMDTAPRWPEGMPLDVFRAAWELAEREGMAKLFELFRQVHTNDPERPAPDRRLEERWGEGYWAWRRANYLAMDPRAYAALGRAMVEQEPVTDRLPELDVPTRVLVGAEDRGFVAPAREMAEALPAADLVVLDGAGHQPQLETPEAWTRAVLEHLARVREQPPPADARAARR